MRPLSAIECISPAIARTRDVLARPFRMGTFFKFAAVAFFADLGAGFNFPGRSKDLRGLPHLILPFFVAFAALLGLVALIVGLILFYVASRLQLVLIELVATRYPFVGPLWRKYSSRTWRWIGLKLLVFLLGVLVAVPLIIAPMLYFTHRAHVIGVPPGGSPFSGLHIVHILLFIAVALLVALLVSAVYFLVRDLALPSLALEDLRIWQSLGRLRALIAAEPGQVILYVIVRLVLSIILGIAAEIAVFLVLLVSLIPPGIVGVILWLSLHKDGAVGVVILIACAVLGALVFFCWAVCVSVAFLGTLFTFFQAYALYFLGGRYPLLGNLLDQSTPPPAYAYPATFPPQSPSYQPPQPDPPPAQPNA